MANSDVILFKYNTSLYQITNNEAAVNKRSSLKRSENTFSRYIATEGPVDTFEEGNAKRYKENLGMKDVFKNLSFRETSNENIHIEMITGCSEETTILTDGKYKTKFSKKRLSETPKEELSDADEKWLQWIEKQFIKIVGKSGCITLTQFKQVLHVKKQFFVDRIFSLFDVKKNNVLDLKEFIDGVELITRGSPVAKLKFLFDVIDVKGNGVIEIDELKLVLRTCMEESSLSFGENNLEALTKVLFNAVDENDSGTITFGELKMELDKYPGVLENLTFSIPQLLRPPTKSKKIDLTPRYFTSKYLRNNTKKVVFLIWYFLMNVGLGIYAGWTYRKSNVFIIIARICGINLNFNCTLVYVLMLRKIMTKLRETSVSLYLPLDNYIMFHKMVGVAIALYSVIHTLAHIGNAVFVDQISDNMELWEILFTTKSGIGWIKGTAFITGWLLVVVLSILVIFSLPCIRRSGFFEVFYFTHMLYTPIWILCILHGPHFWKWFIVPGVLFLFEKISGTKLARLATFGEIFINEVNLLPAGVCHLVLGRPENFKFKPGDYLFINIPVISKHEWHPFTISSAREVTGEIWLHIRSAGSWTNKLYEYFDNVEMSPGIHLLQYRQSNKLKGSEDSNNLENKKNTARPLRQIKEQNKRVLVKCYIDGPYGTGTREIFDTEHAVLIGTGIGVTPMASILQSIMLRYKTSQRICPNCTHTWFDEMPKSLMKLKKVDFIWINRTQKSFEWFVSLLTEIEMDQSTMTSSTRPDVDRMIDMHMYITSAMKKTDMKGLSLQMALDLMRAKGHTDLITGLKSKAEPGRPDWNKVFKVISEENKGRIKVFFCGSPTLGKIVKKCCEKYNFRFCREYF